MKNGIKTLAMWLIIGVIFIVVLSSVLELSLIHIYQYRHPICTICGKKSPVSWFKCPNRPEGIPMNCPG